MMRRSAVDGDRPIDQRVVAGIFVGGRASRMGGLAKGLLEAPDGEPIVVRTKRLLERVGVSSVLVGKHPAYAHLGLVMLADDPAADGPLAGLLALLAHAGDRLAIAVACDMPLVSEDLLRRLVDASRVSGAAEGAGRSSVLGEQAAADAAVSGAPWPPGAPGAAPGARCPAGSAGASGISGAPRTSSSSGAPGVSAAVIVAPRRTDPARGREVWEPLFAQYDAPRVLPIARAFAARGERKLQLLLEEAGACPLALSREEAEALADWDAPSDLPGDLARGRRRS